MRRRLALVSVAVTAMVVVAFVVPLATMVRTLARDRVLVSAERDAQILSQALGILIEANDLDGVRQLVAQGTTVGDGLLSVRLPDGRVIGADFEPTPGLQRAVSGEALRETVDTGEVVWVPVLLSDARVALIRVFVPASALGRNVAASWAVLGALGVALIALSGLVADRLARSIVDPVRELSAAAHRIGEGDITARVRPDGPPEIVEVGEALNRLASRIGELLEAEREAAADVSHRLRTPLTALRLDVEGISDESTMQRLADDVAEVERTVNQIIEELRRPLRDGVGASVDLEEVVRARMNFWQALADEQGRRGALHVGAGSFVARIAAHDAEAMLDALLGNVFAHTPEGVGFSVSLDGDADTLRLVVADEGPGFDSEAVTMRGVSGAGSTGLGLDIVRRTAEAAGGRIEIGSGPGATVEVVLPRL